MELKLKALPFNNEKSNGLFSHPEMQQPGIVLSINHFFKVGYYLAIIPYKIRFDPGKRLWTIDNSCSSSKQKVHVDADMFALRKSSVFLHKL